MNTALIVDDHDAIRNFMITQLRPYFPFVYNEASSGKNAIDLLDRITPQFITLDLQFAAQDLQYMHLAREVRSKAPGAKIFVYTSVDSAPILDSVRPFVNGMARKSDQFKEVFELTQLVMQGDNTAFFASESVTKLLQRSKQAKTGFEQLSTHEMRVLLSMIDGKSTREMAEEIGKSEQTLELYRRQLRAKFEVSSTNELIAKVIRLKLDELIRQKLNA